MEILSRRFILAVLIGFFVVEIPVAHAGISRPMNNRGMVAYWSMEDCRGKKATDSSGRGNDGVLTSFGLTGATSNWVAGKRGACALNFDGSNDYVGINYWPLFDFERTDSFSFSAWVRVSSLASTRGIFSKAFYSGPDYAGYEFSIFTNGALQLFLSAGDATNELRVRSTTGIPTNTWVHVTATYAGTSLPSGVKLYINGVSDTVSTVTNLLSGSIQTTSDGVAVIGAGDNGPGSSRMLGDIDDVRVYNRALTAAEVASLYNAGASKISGSTTRGLLAHWSMEDCRGRTLTDTSGHGNTGTLTNFALTGTTSNWVPGKRGSCALNLDGTDDYISVPQNGRFNLSGTAYSISLWVLDDTAAATLQVTGQRLVFWYYGSNNIQLGLAATGGGTLRSFYLLSGTTAKVADVASTGSAPLGYNHVVGVFNGSQYFIYVNGVDMSGATTGTVGVAVTDSSNLYIGQRGNSFGYTNGILDDVRIYNRALSAAEVAALYNTEATQLGVSTTKLSQGTTLTSGLVGHWTLDGPKLTSTTALDSSGNNYTGTLVGANGRPKPAAGRVGQALKFDGHDDYVTMGNVADVGAGDATLTTWFNSSTTSISAFVSKRETTGSFKQYAILFNYYVNSSGGQTSNPGTLTCWFYGGALTAAQQEINTLINTYNDGQWHHVACRRLNGTGLNIFVDGVQVSTQTISPFTATTNTDASNAGSTNLGTLSDGFRANYPGMLDDARVYNRALTAAEIQQLYNLGR